MDENLKFEIWYEKYRPKKLDDLILNEHNRKILEKCIKAKQIPHLLLHGEWGSGKTTIAKILIEYCASADLQLGASAEDRGIDVIKKKVKSFASNMPDDKNKTNIIFFDEADGLTPDAQMALKNIVERYHKICRFIFTANNFNKVDGHIKSRCIRLQFEQISKSHIIKFSKKILQKENIEYNKKDLKKIVKTFYPDIRSIVNELQSCSISGVLNINELSNPEPDMKKLKLFLDKGNISAIRHLWVGNTDFGWLYAWLTREYIPNNIKDENKAECFLHVANWMTRYQTDKEIMATACLIDILLEQEKEIEI